MKLSKLRNVGNAGFTLFELLVVTAITSLMLILIMTFVVNTMVNNSVDSARADLLREAQFTLDVIARDVRLSATADENNRWVDVNSPNAGATGGLGWESNNNTLVLALAAQNAAGDVLFDDALHYITHKDNVIYFVENNVLYRRRLAGNNPDNGALTSCPEALASASCPADRVMTNNVSSFSVNYYDGDNVSVGAADSRSIEISLELEVEKFGRDITAQYDTRTVFRNE